MIIAVLSFLFINLVFFALSGIGGSSMASVDGVVVPWLGSLIFFWTAAVIPYCFYALILIKNKKKPETPPSVKCTLIYSAWIGFPSGIACFILTGSEIYRAALILPAVQTFTAVFIYLLKTAGKKECS